MRGGAGVCTGIDNIVNRRHNRKSTFIAAFCVFAQFVRLFCGKTRKLSRLETAFKGEKGLME